MAPVFFTESLGNLAKQYRDQRDSSKVVAAMAHKVQGLGTTVNVDHRELIKMNLLGYEVEMRGVPVVGNAQRVQNADGEWGVFIDESPEEKALHRWRVRDFSDDERVVAAQWRQLTKQLDLQPLVRSLKGARGDPLLSECSLLDLKRTVARHLDDEATQFRTLSNAVRAFGLSPKEQAAAKKRWVALGRPAVRHFAPYAAFALRLTMTFQLAVALQRIPERPTNIVDLEYLYYLPFCHVFTSGDKLHRDLAPLFMSREQHFIWAQDLKAALAQFVAHSRSTRTS